MWMGWNIQVAWIIIGTHVEKPQGDAAETTYSWLDVAGSQNSDTWNDRGRRIMEVAALIKYSVSQGSWLHQTYNFVDIHTTFVFTCKFFSLHIAYHTVMICHCFIFTRKVVLLLCLYCDILFSDFTPIKLLWLVQVIYFILIFTSRLDSSTNRSNMRLFK